MKRIKYFVALSIIAAGCYYFFFNQNEKKPPQVTNQSQSYQQNKHSDQLNTIIKPNLLEVEQQKVEVDRSPEQIEHEKTMTYELTLEISILINKLKELRSLRDTLPKDEAKQNRDLLREERRAFEKDLSTLLNTSPEARALFKDLALQEDDPFVRRELMASTRRMNPVKREEMVQFFATSEDPINRDLAVNMLQSVGTHTAISQLSSMATTEKDIEIQKKAIHSLASYSQDRVGEQYASGASIPAILRNLATQEQPLEVREKAFRGLIGRAFLQAEDKAFIVSFAEAETDPKLKQIAKDAVRVLRLQ
ncbi:MAG: hypothetical protein R3A45_08160 [Bdellovibrionota bacterium]